MDCVFCACPPDKVIMENEFFIAIKDKFPVAKGHTLLISKRHCPTFFELTPAEVLALHELSIRIKTMLDGEFDFQGYNLAMNCGRAAGQSIGHFHMHIIPRKTGEKTSAFARIRESLF